MACVVRETGARPRITLCDFRNWDGYDHEAHALERMASDYNLARMRCTTLLSQRDYALLLTEAPDVPPQELAAAVRWRIKDLIDFHINDATVDVFNVPGDNTAGRARAIYAVAARNDAVQRRADLMDAAKINLHVIDIGEMAQRNLAALLPEDNQGVVMLSLNHQGGLITVTRRGEIFLSRSLDVGLDSLTADEDVTGRFDRIVLEIQRSLDYYDSHFRQPPVARLFLAPTAQNVDALVEYLSQNLDVGVATIKLDSLLQYDVKIPPALEAPCLMAIGAALRDEPQSP